ncbi:MAG: hypothetical protein AAF721_21805 [Myxococcota bacterium]
MLGSCRQVAVAVTLLGACAQPRAEAEPVADAHPATRRVPEGPTVGTGPEAPSGAPVEPATARSMVVEGRRLLADDVGEPLAQFVAGTEGGALWAGRLSGNGGRDVLVFIPPGVDPDAPFRLVFHFHGTYSETLAPQAPGMAKKEWVGHKRLSQTLEAITELQRERPGNVAVVYPLSAGKRPEPGWKGWFNKAYDRMWMSPAPEAGFTDDFNRLHDEALAILTERLGVAPSRIEPKVIAEGHSAGGIALRNLAEAGTSHVGHYVFLDASFQSWSDRCWAAVAADTDGPAVTIVQTTKGIADPFEGRDPWCTTMPEAAAAWPAAREFCQGVTDPGKRKPPGRAQTCAAMKTAADEWPALASWCAGLREEFRDIPRLTLVRTKVAHGDQPRRFSGGLGLELR